MAFLGGLLSTIGRGITGGLDQMAYGETGGPLLGSILSDPTAPPLPQAGQDGPQAGLMGPPQAAPVAPPPQQQSGWQPDPATKRMMRGMFLQNYGAGLQAMGRGTGSMADAMRGYQGDMLTMLLTQHQAKAAALAQARQQQAMAGFSQDMQTAGDDEDAQRKAMLKWAPYLPAQSVSAMGGIVRDFKPPKETPHYVTVPQEDGTTKTFAVTTDPKTNTPVLKEISGLAGHAAPKELGDLHVNARGEAIIPALVDNEKAPRMVKFNVNTGQYSYPGQNGAADTPIDISQHTIIPAPKPSAAAARVPSVEERQWNAAMGDFSAKHLNNKPIDQMSPTEQTAAWKIYQASLADEKRPDSSNADFRLLDSEINNATRPHDAELKTIGDHMTNVNNALNLVYANNAEGTATAIPAMLKALVGGQGSGFRMTTAEINQIAQARGITGDIAGWFNKIRGQGSLTGTQKQQIAGLLQDVQGALSRKTDILNAGLSGIRSAGTRADVINAERSLRENLYPTGERLAQEIAWRFPDGGGNQTLTDRNLAARFLQAAGGDKQMAARLARWKHWVVPE